MSNKFLTAEELKTLLTAEELEAFKKGKLRFRDKETGKVYTDGVPIGYKVDREEKPRQVNLATVPKGSNPNTDYMGPVLREVVVTPKGTSTGIMPEQEQVSKKEEREVEKAQIERHLAEVNNQMDHLFTGGPFSPAVVGGALARAVERAFTGDNSFFGGRGDFFHDWLLGNNGIVTDNFAREHPNLTTGLNLTFDFLPAFYNIAHSISPTSVETATGKVMSYIKHPTWKTYYHGSSHPFNIKDFFRGTPQDYGLHMGDKSIATTLSQNASAFQNYGIDLGYSYKPTVYKFRAPRPSTSTIDTHANDFRHLSENFLIKGGEGVRYDLHPGDKFTWNTFKDSGTTLNYFPNSDTYPFTTLSNDIRINMRDFFPKIKNNPELNKRAQDIIDEARFNYTKMKKEGITSPTLEDLDSRIDLNTKTAELLSDAGYPVIKYENLAFGEVPTKFIRSNKPYYSYILTDPSKIDLMEPYKLKTWYTWPYINENK